MSVFGTNLKKYLHLLGWEQSDLAEKLGISAASVSEWIVKGTKPRAHRLEKIAELFGITVNDLLYDFSSPKEENLNDLVLVSKKDLAQVQETLMAKDREIEYLRQIVELQKDNTRLKNIEVVNEGQ